MGALSHDDEWGRRCNRKVRHNELARCQKGLCPSGSARVLLLLSKRLRKGFDSSAFWAFQGCAAPWSRIISVKAAILVHGVRDDERT